MSGHLRVLGVDLILGRQGVAVNGGAILENGEEIRADLVLAATGVDPPDVFARSGLATGDHGALWVDRHLRSPNDHRIFGGADAVAFRGNPLPRFGVLAIRQGPVLFHNLRATLRGQQLSSYRPQRRYLYVLDLGDGPRHLRPAHQSQPPRPAPQAPERQAIRAGVRPGRASRVGDLGRPG